jgi:hypothetical protein
VSGFPSWVDEEFPPDSVLPSGWHDLSYAGKARWARDAAALLRDLRKDYADGRHRMTVAEIDARTPENRTSHE